MLGFIAKNASGNHPHSGPFADKLVDGLKAAAMETHAFMGDAVNFEHLQLEVAIEIDRMRLLESQLGTLGREIQALYSEASSVRCSAHHPRDRRRPGASCTGRAA